MTTRVLLALAFTGLTLEAAFADEPALDRTIGKQPVYKRKAPRFGLLVFGPEARHRVWLVLDGDTLHVDRNGNGDLTDAGETVAADRSGRRAAQDPDDVGHLFEAGDLAVGGHT